MRISLRAERNASPLFLSSENGSRQELLGYQLNLLLSGVLGATDDIAQSSESATATTAPSLLRLQTSV